MQTIDEMMIKTIYERAISYSQIASGMGIADEIHLHENGDISAVYLPYSRGYDTESFTFSFKELNKDLDEVTKQRLIDVENKRIKDEAESKRLQSEFVATERAKRLKTYNDLKKEFENNIIH